MWRAYQQAVQSVNHFGSQEWFYVLIAVVVVGFFCLRGFGSRTGY